MEWMKIIGDSIKYIEDHITDELTIEDIAQSVNVSSFYFQKGFVKKTIPAFDWAVFPCRGAMPDSLQNVNEKIFTEWLPAMDEYEFAAGYCVEMYDDPRNYAKGTADENYYTEIWIPIKKK